MISALIGASAFAQVQTPDPLALVIEPLLRSDSGVVRGEAALALAATGDPRYHLPILTLAEDSDPESRRRAIVALGILGQPGADGLLDRILRKARRDSVDALLAALALGMLPDELRVSALDTFFSRAKSASRRRIRDRLACLLIGLGQADHPQQRTVLQTYLADATYRHRSELALVIAALARVPDHGSHAAFRKRLGARNPDILEAVLHALRDPALELEPKEIRRIVQIADRADDPDLRGTALDLLAFHRHPDALSVAGRALKSKHPACRAAAVRTILKLGGGLLRESIENRILATTDIEHQTAMLHAKAGPHGDAFVKACLELGRDGSKAIALRVEATKVVSEAGWSQIAPITIQLFLAARTPADTHSLAASLRRLDIPVDEKLIPSKTVTDVALLPLRLRALLEAGCPGARRFLFNMLTKPANPGSQLDALRAYRSARVRLWNDATRRFVPPAVKALLKG